MQKIEFYCQVSLTLLLLIVASSNVHGKQARLILEIGILRFQGKCNNNIIDAQAVDDGGKISHLF